VCGKHGKARQGEGMSVLIVYGSDRAEDKHKTNWKAREASRARKARDATAGVLFCTPRIATKRLTPLYDAYVADPP